MVPLSFCSVDVFTVRVDTIVCLIQDVIKGCSFSSLLYMKCSVTD